LHQNYDSGLFLSLSKNNYKELFK